MFCTSYYQNGANSLKQVGGFSCVINIINWYELNFTYAYATVVSHMITNSMPPLLYRLPVFSWYHFIPGFLFCEAMVYNLESWTPLRILWKLLTPYPENAHKHIILHSFTALEIDFLHLDGIRKQSSQRTMSHSFLFFPHKNYSQRNGKFCIIDAMSAQKRLWIHISILRLYEQQ
jgi:hypothetical protein